MKTINLKGKEYAPVSERVSQFHKDHSKGSIETETTFSEGHLVVKATVTFDARGFTGHAFGKVQGEKAFEKLETTAVGRALAFAGYLAGGEIASYDEMEEFTKTEGEPPMEAEEACHKLKVCQSVDNLKAVWQMLPQNMRDDEVVLSMKEEMKSKLK